MILSGLKRAVFIFSLSSLMILASANAVSAAKVNLSPATATITEGQSQVIIVALDQPIICPVIDETCLVEIDVTSNSPDRVVVTSSPVIIQSDEWSQSFSFTVTAIDDNLDNGDVSPIFTLTTTSNSEYYTGFALAFTLSITDNDEPQTVAAVSTTAAGPQLPATGANSVRWVILAAVLMIFSVGVVTLRENYSTIHTKNK